MITNQQLGKLRGVKIPILYAFKKKKDDEDREVETLAQNGFITPQEYQGYVDGDITYQEIMNIHSERMDDDYYMGYIRQSYHEGYLDEINYLWADFSFTVFDDPDSGISFEQYMYDGYDYYDEETQETIHIVPLVNFLKLIYNNRQENPPEPEG